MLLSIAMMVKNESKNLDACLKSLQPIRDAVKSELIIVDTGSTDNTVEIAKKYTDKVYYHPWNNNFSEIRNITIEYSKGEWVFIIDGDEVIENPDGTIEFFVKEQYKKFNSACLNVTNFQNSQKTETSSFLAARFFRKDKDFHFKGAVHNQPSTKEPMAKLKGIILHYGYISDDVELMEKKFQRTSSILKKELEKDPNNIYYRHQLSVSYAMHKDFKEALEEALKAYETLKKSNYDKKQYIYVYNELIKALLKNERYIEAQNIANEVIALDNENIDAFIWLGKTQFLNNDYEKAKLNYERYLELVDKNKNLTSKNLGLVVYTLDKGEIVYIDLFEIYYQNNQFQKCMVCLKAINKEEFYNINLEKIVDCFITLGKYEELREFYIDKNIHENEALYKTFVCVIETRVKELEEIDRCEVFKYFTEEESNYDYFNRIRINFYNEKFENVVEMTEILLNKINLNEAVDFFGDAFYILLSMKKSVSKYFSKISERNINTYLDFAKESHEDYIDKVLDYLKLEEESLDFAVVKTKKVLVRSLLSFEDMDNQQYLSCFKKYVHYGISYIKLLYNQLALDNEFIYDVKNDEEVFFVYMYQAEKVKNEDTKLYIQYLRKSLHQVLMLSRGIELLLRELEEKNNEPTEMDLLKKQLKDNIRIMIENKKILKAEEMIRQYEEIVPEDVEILLFKSQISLMKMGFEDHEGVLN